MSILAIWRKYIKKINFYLNGLNLLTDQKVKNKFDLFYQGEGEATYKRT